MSKNTKSLFNRFIEGFDKKSKYAPPVKLCKMTVEDSIPIDTIHEKYNLIEVYPGMYTRSYYIGENNYQTETEEVEQNMFIKYRYILNSLGSDMEYSLSIFNKNINLETFKELALKKESGDKLDYLRRELNEITLDRIKEGRNGLEKCKYVTIGVHSTDVKKAADIFDKRLDDHLDKCFQAVSSYCKPIPMIEKLEILHDIYNIDEQGEFMITTKVLKDNGEYETVYSFDFDNIRTMGCDIKEMIAPSSIQFFDRYMRIGKKFARVMKITNYPASITDDFFVKLTDVSFNMISTFSVAPLEAKDAQRIVHTNMLAARMAKAEESQRLARENIPADLISPDVEDKVEKSNELRKEMQENDEKLFKTTYTLFFYADSLEELNEYTDSIITTCQGSGVFIKTMTKQQEKGFNTTLPLCYNELKYGQKRTLKSSSVATLCQPFSNLELSDAGGINYSMNLISKNLILYDRLQTQNFNGFILGTPGCFTGDTEVLVISDTYIEKKFIKNIGKFAKKMSLQEMALSEKPVFNIISLNPKTNEFVIAKGRHVRETKRVQELAYVTLSNGKTEKCTLEHLWMTSNCDYVQAKDLKVGTRLKSLLGTITVTKIEIKTNLAIPVPVYDLEAENPKMRTVPSLPDYEMPEEDFENYLLGSGVIVHNSGKSFTAKVEMLNVILGSNSDCYVLDPEAEYLALAKLIGGEVIKIEPGGKWHINPMEITVDYEWTDDEGNTETNPVLAKADFILKLMETMVKTPFGLNSIQETIIDECVHQLYAPFIKKGVLQKIPEDKMPTLTDLQRIIAGRKEPEARELAMALKLYTGTGSLNTFGFRSNVDTKNRFIVYNIKDVGEKLKPIAMLIILDAIQNKLFDNRKKGKFTWFWVDEIYLLFQDEMTASFLNMLFKRARKYGGVPTGITQNVEDLLESNTARKMLSNCNFVQILNQAPSDRAQLAELLRLSESQVDVITSSPKGQGLIWTGSNCVGFHSVFPKNNSIYKCLTSNMKEIKAYEEEEKRREAQLKKALKKKGA